MKAFGIITFALSFTIFFGINHSAYTQEFVEYHYDDAGNRVLRRVIVIPPKLTPEDSLQVLQQSETQNNKLETSEKLGDCQAIIYPNPTGGTFILEISGSFDVNSSILSLYSVSGIELDSWKHLMESNSMDVSTFPTGNYILILSLNGYSTSWKLIKE